MARVRINLYQGELDIEGSEDFILQEQKELLSLLKDNKPQIELQSKAKPESLGTAMNPMKTSFPEIFSIDESGHVSVIRDLVEMRNKSDKMKSLALIYLFAKRSVGENITDIEEVRGLCIKNGSYDGKNFMTVIKKAKEGKSNLFLVKEVTGNKKIELSNPGITAAKKLLEALSLDNEAN